MAAIKKGFRASSAFDSRGQLYLRRGEMDKAILDFKAALKLQPKNATAMYGLGIAQRTQGVAAEGENNIQAASTLMPEVKTHYSRLNIDTAPKESRTE
jgi:tetratricopeptide (TPR) repeat protein